jgi:hypothetical protein
VAPLRRLKPKVLFYLQPIRRARVSPGLCGRQEYPQAGIAPSAGPKSLALRRENLLRHGREAAEESRGGFAKGGKDWLNGV